MEFRIGDEEIKYPLSNGIYTIGRTEVFTRISGPGSAEHSRIIGPPNPTISRRHLEIKVSEKEAVLRDLGSLNGTLLDGGPMKTATIDQAGTYKLMLGSFPLYLEAK